MVIGNLYVEKGELDEALNSFNQYVDQFPDDPRGIP